MKLPGRATRTREKQKTDLECECRREWNPNNPFLNTKMAKAIISDLNATTTGMQDETLLLLKVVLLILSMKLNTFLQKFMALYLKV